MKIDKTDAEHRRIGSKKKKEALVKAEIKNRMNETITCLDLDIYKKKQFFKQQDGFLKNIQEYYSSNYFVFAYNLVVSKFNSNVKQKKWDATKLSKLTPERHESHFRTNLWFFRFDELSKWVILWEEYLSEPQNKTFSKQDVLASIVLSSICYGGLNNSIAVLSLINTLINKSKPLNHGDFYWIDLPIFERGFDKNFEIGGEKVHIKTWYPDNYSLLWINNLLNNFTLDMINFDIDSLSKFILSWMKKTAKNVDSNFNLNSIKSIKDICDVGVGIAESSPGTRLNQTLVGYAKGEIKSSSLAPDYFKNIVSNEYSILETPYQPEESKKKDRELNTFLYRLVRLLTDDNESNREHILHEISKYQYKYKLCEYKYELYQYKYKLSKYKYENQLSKYKCKYEQKSEYILLSWLVYRIKAKNIRIKTLRKYISAIGHDWLKITDETFMDYEELESFYGEIIEESASYYYGILKELHEYAVKIKEISEVSIFKNKFLKDTAVSTGFLTEKFFYNLISDLVNSKNRFVKKDMYLVLFIIAFRTGFRISEILKIRVRDIEINDLDLWIYVSVNQYGSHKTKCATRKFPLGLFLTTSENKLIRKYIEIKKIKPNVKKSTPLFGFDFNPAYGLTRTPVNRITRQYITQKYETKITFHTFRHTALSRLHFILSDNEYLIDKLTNYDKSQISKIQDQFNYNGKNSFWNLAALAGHNSPFTTFSSYLHFTDFLLYSGLKGNSKTINYSHLLNGSGCNYQYLTSRISQNPSITKEIIPFTKIDEILNDSLSRHITTIKIGSDTEYDLGMIFNKNNENYIQPQDCYHILCFLEKDNPIDELANKLNISKKIMTSWLNAAEEIFEYQSQLKKPRHFKENRIKNKLRKCLAPSRPQSRTEIEDCEYIADNYQAVWDDHPNEFKNSLLYFLQNSVASRPGLSFACPKKLNDYLIILSKFFTKSRIRIKLNLTECKGKIHTITDQEKIWVAAINTRATKTRVKNFKSTKYPVGKATVSIKHLKERTIKKNRKTKKGKYKYYHTNSVKFSFHLLAILHLDDLKYHLLSTY